MGSYVISVSAGTGCYRHIQISKTATLHKLHKAIINAFDFEDDHEYAFLWTTNIGVVMQRFSPPKCAEMSA